VSYKYPGLACKLTDQNMVLFCLPFTWLQCGIHLVLLAKPYIFYVLDMKMEAADSLKLFYPQIRLHSVMTQKVIV